MRRGELAVMLTMVYGPLVAGLIALVSLSGRVAPPAVALAASALWVAGLSLLVVAKLSLFRRGVWISWGPARMSAANRRLYLAGYALLIAGALLLVP